MRDCIVVQAQGDGVKRTRKSFFFSLSAEREKMREVPEYSDVLYFFFSTNSIKTPSGVQKKAILVPGAISTGSSRILQPAAFKSVIEAAISSVVKPKCSNPRTGGFTRGGLTKMSCSDIRSLTAFNPPGSVIKLSCLAPRCLT
jgi:hypothetical protein